MSEEGYNKDFSWLDSQQESINESMNKSINEFMNEFDEKKFKKDKKEVINHLIGLSRNRL